MWRYQNTDELYHYGILGMRWGHRKVRETSDDIRTKKAKTSNNSNNTKKQKKKLTKGQKVAIGTAAVAATLVAAYGGYKLVKNHMDKYGDKTIKANTEIQHLGKNAVHNLDKTFYASFLKSDNKKYLNSKSIGHDNKWNIKQTITPLKDIKIAGKKESINTFKEWSKNNEQYKTHFKPFNNDKKSIERAYNDFIKEAPAGSEYYRKIADSFFKELKKKGYQATRDTYDQRLMKTKAPIIIFGNLENLKNKKIEKI